MTVLSEIGDRIPIHYRSMCFPESFFFGHPGTVLYLLQYNNINYISNYPGTMSYVDSTGAIRRAEPSTKAGSGSGSSSSAPSFVTQLTGPRPLTASLAAVFWSAVNTVMLFFQTIFSPPPPPQARNSYGGSSWSTAQRGGGGGGGGGSSTSLSSSSAPPRRGPNVRTLPRNCSTGG